MRTLTIALFLSLSTSTGVALGDPPRPGQCVVLEMHRGFQVEGEFVGMDAGNRLWLISREAGIELRSGYHVSKVANARVRGKLVPLDSLTKGNPATLPPFRVPPAVPPPVVRHSLPGPRDPFPRPPAVGTAKSLDVVAELANWDEDAEVDGIRVYITPRDARGRSVSVGGQLSAVLESNDLIPGPIRQGGNRAPRVELHRWGKPLRKQDFGPEGVVAELPFDGRRRPDLHGVDLLGRLRVRLSIPGGKALEALTVVPLGYGR